MHTLRKQKDLKQPNFIPQGTSKRKKKGKRKRKRKPKVSRRKERTKIRAKINEIDTRKTIEKIDKTKSCFFKSKKQTKLTIF